VILRRYTALVRRSMKQPGLDLRSAAATALVAAILTWPGTSAQVEGPLSPQPVQDSPASRFLAGISPPVTSYRARRRLEAENRRFGKRAWMEARTTVDATGFSFEVIAEGGSEYVRRKVLRPALEAERDAIRRGTPTAFVPANYDFTDAGLEDGLARVRLTPRRKEKFLIDGWLLLDPADGALVEVRGRPAKAPSFWTTRVEIVRRYARLFGVSVPVLIESTASVRIAGRSTFAMRYVYETINGVSVTE
jgi:hypothetical protein